MGADSLQQAIVAAAYSGVALDNRQEAQLLRFHRWLTEEAIPAGGVGPHEQKRLWTRHIADSLLFGIGLSRSADCLDIGSGIGLPGIPLAVAYPQQAFVLLERSGRRCDLAQRAIAILGLENCTVRQADVEETRERFGAIVSRAAMPPNQLLIHVKRILKPGGVALLGLSRSSGTQIEAPEDDEVDISMVEVPTKILDTPVYLLRIEAT